MSCNVLISSAGRRVVLLDQFRLALADLGVSGRVLATDASPLASAFHRADDPFLVPPCTSDDFVPSLLEICRTHDVQLVVPTIDAELPALATNRHLFAEAGTTIAISSLETITIAADKVRTHAWLREQGFPTVRQANPTDAIADRWPLPLVVKPRSGSASTQVMIVHTRVELELAAAVIADAVVEELAPGSEHTVDVFVDRSGDALCAVPRRRLAVRGGEVAKAVTVHQPLIEGLASVICEHLPGAYGALNVQMFIEDCTDRVRVIEINPRFGGGFPLAWEAGARFPHWLVEDVMGLPTSSSAEFRDGLVMLRYDDAVFVDASSVGL